ncbi:MAG: Uma2 family endonuclease [Isosphaeraceae bacterium]|nr:Uma2 family endonuclease [Isosphaeraceae bacterium]
METHWCGGRPDFVVEVLSRGDRAHEMLGLCATFGVRALLLIDRDPWALELHSLRGDQSVPTGVASRRSLGPTC